jgi:poly(A) polymerase
MSASENPPPTSPSERTPVEPVIYTAQDHIIRKNDIDEDARKIVYRLQRAGFKAYIVGGGVRDILLGKTPKDFDISTDATPKQIKALFRNCRIIGRRFKLAHIFFGQGKTLEVSTFRDFVESLEPTEDESGAATPVANDNLYGTEETDALRRDLTINGLFLDVSTMEIIDYVNGIPDLRQGIVRIIGEPDIRFREDPVRMLRVVRHSARNGFHIDPQCWASIVANSQLITQSSQVRVFDELKKDLTSGCFLTILSLLGETGLLEHLLPELLENSGRLLSAESDFSICMEKIDDAIAEGSEISPTVVLSIIGLFASGDSIWLRDLAESITTPGDLNERLSECFTHLMVPRKERERIILLLTQWTKLRAIAPNNLKVGSYKRSALLPDLVGLLEITGFTREDTQRAQMLKTTLDSEHMAHEHHDHPQRPLHMRRRR